MLRFWVPVFVLFVPGCDGPPPEAPNPDALVLELGGSHQPLREALRAVSGERAPAPSERRRATPTPPATPPAGEPVVVPGTRPVDVEPATEAPPAQPEPQPQPEPEPEPEPEPQPRSVALGEGQTLYALARDLLGDANRWRELLALNGWTEEQARRLRPGTQVKLPPQ